MDKGLNVRQTRTQSSRVLRQAAGDPRWAGCLRKCLSLENSPSELRHTFCHLTDTPAINNSMKNEEGGGITR